MPKVSADFAPLLQTFENSIFGWTLFSILFFRENKDLKLQQARTSVEIVKEIKKDTSLKSNAERDRRLREKHSHNTKIFIDERKTCAMKQEKRREKLKKQHEAQLNDLVKYVQNVRYTWNM